jgi:hypothetical protein
MGPLPCKLTLAAKSTPAQRRVRDMIYSRSDKAERCRMGSIKKCFSKGVIMCKQRGTMKGTSERAIEN